MLFLAGRGTWSYACWVGIFQKVAIPSIMPGRQPHIALAARELSALPTSVRASRRLQKVLEPLARAMDRPAAESKRGGGEGAGYMGSVSQPEKHLSRRRHCNKSVAARKYDFTRQGMRERRRAARLKAVQGWECGAGGRMTGPDF